MERTVGPREGLAAGIIALGILMCVLPGVIDQFPAVAGGGNATFSLYGMTVLLGLFVIGAGVLSFFIKD
jgi:hypothetical protein